MRRERYSGRFSRLKELVTFENWEQLRGLESTNYNPMNISELGGVLCENIHFRFPHSTNMHQQEALKNYKITPL